MKTNFSKKKIKFEFGSDLDSDLVDFFFHELNAIRVDVSPSTLSFLPLVNSARRSHKVGRRTNNVRTVLSIKSRHWAAKGLAGMSTRGRGDGNNKYNADEFRSRF